MGKTAFIMQTCLDLVNQGKSVMYLSFEMRAEELLERLFSHIFKIDNFELLSGKFSYYQEQFIEFVRVMNTSRFIISYGFANNWEELDEWLTALKTKPDVLVIDYVQAIPGSSSRGKEFIDDYILHFADMAKRENFAGILVSQINREAVGEKSSMPKLSNLKGSGALEERADCVILLYHPYTAGETQDIDKYLVHIAKNRNGRTGYIKLKYTPQYYLFEDLYEEALVKPETVKEIFQGKEATWVE